MRLAYVKDKEILFEETENFEFPEAYDVIVVGLGTAGAIAAIMAAKKGLKVLGIDRINCMGGMGTAGGVMGYYFGLAGGYYEKIDTLASRYNGNVYIQSPKTCAEAKKYVLEQEAVRAGVVISYESTILGVFLDGKIIKGVRCLMASGVGTIGCKVLIDATGDGDICKMIGCQVNRGRNLDGQTQPFTSVKVSAGANGIGYSNHDSGCVNQTDGEELTKAIITSSAFHLQETYGQGQSRLLYLAPLIGLREGWLIEGEEKVTLEDFLQGKRSAEPVFYAYADVDKHGWDNALESDTLQEWYVASNLGAVNICVPVPLGAMIPKGYEGILAAGRCIALDHDMLNCIRMQRDMQKAGEVAGVAAYLSVEEQVPLKAVSYSKLLSLLKETGCHSTSDHAEFCFGNPRNQIENQRIEWITSIETIKEGLAGEKPGVAIWSAKQLGEKVIAFLKQWIKDDHNQHLKKHSAIALALVGEREALPLIREMIGERDSFILKDCRKNNQLRGNIAIYLAGKLKDAEIIDELIDIICNPEEFNREIYHDSNLITTRYNVERYNNVYFQFFSHSIMALLKIGGVHTGDRNKIKTALEEALKEDLFIARIVQKEADSYEYWIAANIKNIVKKYIMKW